MRDSNRVGDREIKERRLEEKREAALEARAGELSTRVPIVEEVCPWVLRRLQVGSRG